MYELEWSFVDNKKPYTIPIESIKPDFSVKPDRLYRECTKFRGSVIGFCAGSIAFGFKTASIPSAFSLFYLFETAGHLRFRPPHRKS